jgi:uncharacterized protein YecT (DUF1311 family)
MNMVEIICLAVSFSALAFAPPAGAANCADPQTRADMNICAGQNFAQADAGLNSNYRALLAKITPSGQASLRTAQRAWLDYRDKECAFETAGSADGSVHPMMETECRTALTGQQTARLKAQLDCQEGDLSCGGQ